MGVRVRSDQVQTFPRCPAEGISSRGQRLLPMFGLGPLRQWVRGPKNRVLWSMQPKSFVVCPSLDVGAGLDVAVG